MLRRCLLRLVFVLLATLGGWGAARAAVPDCAGGAHVFLAFGVFGQFASAAQACAAEPAVWGGTAVLLPGGCFVSTPVGDFVDFISDVCTAPTSGSSASSSPYFDISPQQGAQIAGAVLAVWALGFGARMLIRALNIDGDSSSTSERSDS